MPLQKLQFRPGVNREGTTLANEGGWFDCDKIRFRSGYPEKLGGWTLLSSSSFIGTCRSLWNWITLLGYNLMGVGTEKKFYIENGGTYYDITPIRHQTLGTATFAAVTTSPYSSTITVTDINHGAITGDYVTFSGAASLGGNITADVLNQEYAITYVDSNTYTFTATATSNSSDSGSGGSAVVAAYQLNNGTNVGTAQTGWGAGLWGGVITGAQINQLDGTITDSATTITVDSTVGFPTGSVASPGVLLIGSELITYTGSGGTTFTGCSRGALGTTAAAHLNNTLVVNATNYYGWGQSASQTSNTTLRLWSQSNFGEDLLFNPRGGAIYIWQPGSSAIPAFSTRGTVLGEFAATIDTTNTSTTITVTKTNGYIQVGDVISGTGIPAGATIATGSGYTGTFTISAAATATSPAGGVDALIAPQSSVTNTAASTAPTLCNEILVSDSSRIVIAFGCNEYGSSSLDPMFIRWSAQESYTDWTPSATNQAGSYRLSHGSAIIGVLQTRQEILVWTDAAIYSMQYLGPPYVFGFTLLADNISICSPNAMATAAGVTYWMGTDKFYVYSGRVETLPCAVRTYVYEDINRNQFSQCFASTNEGFSEVWWFYCSANSDVIDRYVIFNYLDRVWYYGSMSRTAWIDSPLRPFPMAATLGNQLVSHESGNDDGTTNPPTPIYSYIQSSDFDIGDGHNYGFVWRMLPDVTFDGSTTPSPLKPEINMTMRPRQNPGSAYGAATPQAVESKDNYATQNVYTVQQFTEIVYTRVRGRQLAFKIESNSRGTQWQLGVPRLDVRPDGRR